MKQRLLSAFSWVLTAHMSRQVSFLIVNAILFERLSRSTFGALTLAFGYMSVFAGLGDFGVRQIGWRDIARQPERTRELADVCFTARITSASLTMLLYLALMPLLWSEGLPPVIYVIYALGICLNGGTFDFPLFGLNRIDLYAKYSLISFGLYLAGSLVLVVSDQQAWMVPALFAGAMTVLFALELRWFRSAHGPLRLRFDRIKILEVFRESWSLGFTETLNRLTVNYPLILIGIALGSVGVGNYRIAELAYSFLAQLGHMLASAGFSHLAHLYQHQRSALPKAVYRMLAAALGGSLVIGASLGLAAPLAYEMAFGPMAPETIGVLRLLGLAMVFAGPARFMRTLLASIDRQRALLVLSAIGVAIGALLGWILMRSRGIEGMAIGVAASEAFTFVALLGIYRYTFRTVVAADAEIA